MKMERMKLAFEYNKVLSKKSNMLSNVCKSSYIPFFSDNFEGYKVSHMLDKSNYRLSQE